jgi:cephalosporin hydroxylase
MIVEIDDAKASVTVRDGADVKTWPMDSPEAFAAISKAWLRCGWDTKYVYSFSWLGRPIIQLPEDMFRVQEVIHAVKPDVIIETGVAHGGSLIFYASLFKAMGRGRVIGIDVEIRPHNRAAIEAHDLFSYITLIEGSSVDPAVVDRARRLVRPGETVFVMLDSNHTKQHVLDELRAYGSMVTPGSYIVVADGIMEHVVGAPRSQPDWAWNNPKAAALEFVREDGRFVIEEPAFPFNEGVVRERVTYWPSAYVRRVK